MQFMHSSSSMLCRGAGIILQHINHTSPKIPIANRYIRHHHNAVIRPLAVGGTSASTEQRRLPIIVSAFAATLLVATSTNNNNTPTICAPLSSSSSSLSSSFESSSIPKASNTIESNKRTKYTINDHNKDEAKLAARARKTELQRERRRKEKEPERVREREREREYEAKLIRHLGYNYKARQELKGTPYTKQYKSPPNKSIRSFKIDNVFEIDPELTAPVLRLCNALVLSPVNSDDGMQMSMDAKKGNEARVNMNNPSALVHYYGKDILGGKEIVDKDGEVYKKRAAYATGHGSGTKGICKTQLKNRSFDKDMEFVSIRLRQIILERHPWLLYDPSVNMAVPTNHMTSLVYTNKYQQVKKKEQMPLHTDMAYEKRHLVDKSGEKKSRKKYWLPCKNNSQMVATPTINLSVFDPRPFNITEQKPGNVKKQPNNLVNVEWLLRNGTVTFIHPLDEKPKLNTKNYITQLKHGKISYGGDDRISMCLGFRTTVAKLICHERTGSVFVNDDDREKFKERDAMLENVQHLGYTKQGHAKGCNVKEVESKLRQFYKGARSRWFTKTW